MVGGSQLIQQTAQAKQQNNQNAVLEMYKLFKNSDNPEQMLSQVASKNPTGKKLMDSYNSLMQLSNGNPEQLFYAKCQEQGIDPNSIISMLQNV